VTVEVVDTASVVVTAAVDVVAEFVVVVAEFVVVVAPVGVVVSEGATATVVSGLDEPSSVPVPLHAATAMATPAIQMNVLTIICPDSLRFASPTRSWRPLSRPAPTLGVALMLRLVKVALVEKRIEIVDFEERSEVAEL
jgi:hypothetical protein